MAYTTDLKSVEETHAGSSPATPILTLYYKVYGPYTRADGRKHVILYDGVKRTTLSYPRYLMANHLGRDLLPEETVDHIDGDFTNDAIENLQILTREENSAKEGEVVAFICPQCRTRFELRSKKLRNSRVNGKKGKVGPFCTKKCAGKYGSELQKQYRQGETDGEV